jgi:hypothetical protein
MQEAHNPAGFESRQALSAVTFPSLKPRRGGRRSERCLSPLRGYGLWRRPTSHGLRRGLNSAGPPGLYSWPLGPTSQPIGGLG